MPPRDILTKLLPVAEAMDFPKEILLDVELDNKEKLENWLSRLKKAGLKILNPQRGEKRELVGMCRKNADLHLRELIAKKVKRKDARYVVGKS